MTYTPKQLRKLAISSDRKINTIQKAEKELYEYAKLGFCNTSFYIDNFINLKKIKSILKRRKFKVYVSSLDPLLLEIEW